LLELMLVLVILAILAGGVTIGLEAVLASGALRAAGEQVRVAFVKARLDAIQSGEIVVFDYVPETGSYSVQPWAGFGDNAGAVVPLSGPTKGNTLPDGTVFHTSLAETDSRSLQLQASGEAADGSRSQPIFFYPDGSTSTAYVIVKNERDSYVRVSLRGLTGVANATDLLAADELSP